MKKSLLLFASLLMAQLAISQNALNFDGTNDFVQTTYGGVLGSNARTFEAWIYLNVTPTGNKCIMDYGRNVVYGRNTFGVNTSRSLVYLSGGNNISSNTNVIPVATWTHVAFVLDSGTGYFYVNGTQVGSGPLPLVSTPSGWDNLKIGNRVSGGNIYFPGVIDEVRIWDVARTQIEIASTMNNEFCSAPAALKAYYKFNQGTAGGTNTAITSATDDAGTNNGTLTNFSLSGTSSNWVTGKNLSPVTVANTYPISACGSYTMPDGTIITTSGTYFDTIGSNTSCDTLASYVITFTPAVIKNTVNDSGCVSYTTAMGTMITASGTYYDTLTTTSACDTTIQYNIVISGAVDDSVYRVGARIRSHDTWAIHQWIRCDSSNLPISGATSSFIDVTTPGDYAVIITRGSCVDTSKCINFNPAGIEENHHTNFFLYPNPATNVIQIASLNQSKVLSISVLDISGKIVLNQINIKSNSIDIKDLESGVYLVKIETREGNNTVRFVKK